MHHLRFQALSPWSAAADLYQFWLGSVTARLVVLCLSEGTSIVLLAAWEKTAMSVLLQQ